VEMGFITNATEEKVSSSPAYQASVVQSIVDAVVRFRDYLDSRRPPTASTTPAPRPPALPNQEPPEPLDPAPRFH
jgi:hypothetical protein